MSFIENLQGGRKMTSIYVVGSLSIDLVVSTNKVPSKGETVLGESSLRHLVKRQTKQ